MYSIVIPTYCNYNYLKLCVDSILENSRYNTHQLCIHVNGYEPETVNYLDSKNINYTITQDNVGVPRGLDAAIRQATCDDVIVANDDYYFTKDWDHKLKCWMERIDRVYPDHLKFVGFQVAEPGRGSFPPACNAGESVENFNIPELYRYIDENSKPDVGHWLYASTYPREVLNIYEPSDSFYPKSCSDIDFIMQLMDYLKKNEINYLIFSVKDCFVYHFQGKSSGKNCPVDNRKNGGIFKEKWGISVNDAYNLVNQEVIRSIKMIQKNVKGKYVY